MKVNVNYDLCVSTGSCTRVAPEVFELRDDGYLYVIDENPRPELHARCREAEELCPTGAITLED